MTNRRHKTGAALDDLVEGAKGLAHPARLRLLAMLAGGELCVCQMTAVLELAPSTVSQHLSVLSRGGLVSERKTGKLVFYRLREDGAAATLVTPLLGLLTADAIIKSDRAVVARLRRVPIAVLCAADLDLEAVGVRARRTQTRQDTAEAPC
jgi:DNA-binding transcriptional ArsR family regulator